MKQLLTLLVLVSVFQTSCNKPEEITSPEFSKTYGGKSTDVFVAMTKSFDGGYVMAGTTESTDGDIFGNHGDADAWVVKEDASGNKVWQTCLGGSRYDAATSIVATPDGGYIVIGAFNSSDGDFSVIKGERDAFVIKLDGNGKKLWIKVYGGSQKDDARKIIATPDGGYLIVGDSFSNDGDFVGNKGEMDVWVMKIDGNGNKLWQRFMGGSKHDFATSALATTDGYIIVANTQSSDGDVTSNKGEWDMWLIKVDVNGNKMWDKTYGDSFDDAAGSLISTPDGGYVLGGNAVKDFDIKLVAIRLDKDGNKLWDKSYGGSHVEFFSDLISTPGGGYLLLSNTLSNDGDVIGNHGGEDAWVVKIDENGKKLWQKTYGSEKGDRAFQMLPTGNGGYILCGITHKNSEISNSDAWLVRFTAP